VKQIGCAVGKWGGTDVDGEVRVRMTDSNRVAAMAVVLDSRFRVLLPYFIRVQKNWEPGVRLMVLAAPVQGVLAALPMARVAAALLSNS
jgi:hypothetical protein